MNYYDEEVLERDMGNDNPDGLPTYDYLHEQEGANPNSRFGRWKGWVEKRAAERFADITPEERQQRRTRGWGPTLQTDIVPPTTGQYGVNSCPPLTNGSHAPLPPPQVTSVRLGLSHLSVHEFGSRFVPHSTLPIQALLPLPSTHFLLMADSEGLAMLDIIPDDGALSAEASVAYVHALEAAKRRDLWLGEGVYQLAVLEDGFDENGIPQGVVLATVGVDGEGQEHEVIKSIRIYNLASLTSLATYFATQTDAKTLDLARPKDWSPQEPKRTLRKSYRHHSHNSLTRGVKSFRAPDMSLNANQSSLGIPPFPVNTTRSPNRSPNPSASPLPRVPPQHQDSTNSTDSWCMLDDMPLRWATDYVPLATPNSRLANSSVSFFELWKNDSNSNCEAAMLAIATKTSILLYETKGERAFRFVKEFYTPQPARSINFVHQAAVDDGRNAHHLTVLDTTKHNRGSGFGDTSGRSKSLTVGPSIGPRLRRVSTPGDGTYGSQLSLFVVFDKKAGLIRIGDSAVDEIEMYDDGTQPPVLPIPEKSPSLRRSLQAFDAFGFGHNHKGAWLPLCSLAVPTGAFARDGTPLTRPIVLISRGRQTHIHPSPLPVPLAWSAPLRSIWWNQPPSHVTARVCGGVDRPPFLQVIAYGDGVEVVELDFAFLASRTGLGGKGKGRAAPVEPTVKAYAPAFDHSRFACRGGEWHLLDTTHGRPEVRRSMQGVDGLDTRELEERVKMDEGFYGWYMKDVEDYRVFWMGNIRKEQDGMPDISRLSVRV